MKKKNGLIYHIICNKSHSHRYYNLLFIIFNFFSAPQSQDTYICAFVFIAEINIVMA